MASLRIYGTLTSPPTRVARVAALEFGHQIEFCPMAWRVSPDELFDINPAGRVPVLVHGDVTLWDSRQIWAYVEALPDSKPHELLRPLAGPHRWHEANAVTLAYEVMAAMMVVRGMSEAPPVQEHPYLARNVARRSHALCALDAMASDGWLVDPKTFGLAEVVMICATDALVGREVMVIDDYPNLASIRLQHSTRMSLVETLSEY
jgi:glutathione S-transferase